MSEPPGAYAGPSDQAEVRAVPEVREATDAAVSVGRLRLDELLRELVDRAGEVLATQGRLRRLLDAVVAIGEDLSLPVMLERIVAAACQLVDARYGALGVLAPDRRRLSQFITVGINQVDAALIGNLPQGRGILGLLINEPQPLRLGRLGEHPASYGFPANHPPMSSFLGVPLRVRDQVFGNLYLTEKAEGRDFTEEDEQLIVALAAAAGVAIQNAQLYDDEQRNRRWMAASEEITSVTLQGDREVALDLIAARARELANARHTALLLPLDDDVLVVESADGPAAAQLIGRRVDAAGTPVGDVVKTDPVVIEDSPDLSAVLGHIDDVSDDTGGRAILVPMRGKDPQGGPGGVLVAVQRADEPLAHPRDVEMLATFAAQAAVALELARAQEDRSRLAVFEDRDRIARDLHDLVIQRLFAVGMSLQSAARLVQNPEVGTRIGAAVDDLDETIREVRQTIFHLQAAEEGDDLRVRIQRLVDDVAGSHVRPRLHLIGPVASAVPDEVQGHALAVLREALSNAVRHAQANEIDVTVEAEGDRLTVVVTDNGVGMPAEPTRRSGLANMQRRAKDLGGSLHIEPGAGGAGTTLRWSVPLAPRW